MTNEKELKLTNIEKMEIIGALNNDISFMRHIGMNYKKPEAYENGFKFYIDRDKFEVMLILGIPFTDMIGARIII